LVFLNPQPSDDELARIYSADYFLGSDTHVGRQAVSQMKQATARVYLAQASRYSGLKTGRLLEVGCGDGDLLVTAEAEGWQVTGVEYSASACQQAQRRLKQGHVLWGQLEQAGLPPEHFDLCILSDVIEHVRDPLGFMREIHRLLRPGGTLLIATPSIDSWSARLMKQKWMEFKTEHLNYFGRQTLQTALARAGFRDVVVGAGWKVLSLDYIKQHFERFPVPLLTPLVKFAVGLLPRSMRTKHRRLVASGMLAFSRKAEVRPKPVLSVIVPVFNEVRTLEPLMQALLRKEVPKLDIEIIIVESNSSDGTRELALKYQSHPRVKLLLEERPRGKGHAVRAGLNVATGDYILIQDADLEYDLEDYDALLEPLLAGRCAFVLGSRHGGHNVLKMRQFTGQRSLSLFVNLGHRFFATLVNALLLERLRDPFTMFKVFRRDCLYGLQFECNRFDFDFELLIKLIRKGFRPIELPVNYRSRSFAEGKKVRLFRDPLTWLKALLWLRFVKIDPMSVAERSAQSATSSASTSIGAPSTARPVIAISGGPWSSNALPQLQLEGCAPEIRRECAPQPAHPAEQRTRVWTIAGLDPGI
jgi:glycosyltransferase involved in cell wall biosynthesis/2-polyprenyl-3-methyl-5-hydroxy-6-metoxy-1,4-benzoquinol methylase